jgi:hypothetical protein
VQSLRKEPKERLFDNYFSVGFGNYMSPFLNAFLHAGDQRYNDFGIFLNYHSSEGDIKDLLLDDNYSDTKVDLYYKQFERNFNWTIKAGYNRQRYNYYGLPTNVTYTDNVINSIDEKQVFSNFYIGGSINFDDSFFKAATVQFSNFIDYYNSNEFRFLLQPTFEFPISSELINLNVLVDYVSGKFDQNYWTSKAIDYSFLNVGLAPNFKIDNNNLSLNLGAKLYYAFDMENNVGKFKAYPNITASFRIVDDIFVITAGVTGDLIQNTYKDFTNENPFVSPTLQIKQTDQVYNAFIGAKGKFSSNFGYNFIVSYNSEKDKALVVQNQTQTDGIIPVNKGYEAGNSFNIVYDHVNNIAVVASINYQFSKEFQLIAGLDYAESFTTTQLDAWNLPNLATIEAEYKTKKWYAGTKMFFAGTSHDFIILYGELPENGTIHKNKAYVDLNFNGGYIFSNRLSIFAKVNNAIGNNYDRFVNYPVQSIQVLAGVTYKFDL